MRFMKKWVTVAAAAGAVSMALAGCGGTSVTGGSEVKASDGDVTIRISWWGSDTRTSVTEEAIKGFEKEHPNIKVETTYSDWSGYWDKLATENAGKNAPDIMQMDELYLASYANRGSLFDLGRASEYLDLGQMDSSLRDMGKVDGTQYAAPASSSGFGVIINNDVVNKLGLTVPDTSKWTWDELTAFAKQVVRKSGGSVVGIDPLGNGYSLQLWARQHGESLFKDGKISISQKTLASYLQLNYDWTHGSDPIAGTPDHRAEESSGTLDQGDFATSKQAMKFSAAGQLSTFSRAAGTDNMTLAPMPNDNASTKYDYIKPAIYWAVSSQSQHPAEAAMLIDYLITDEAADKLLGTNRGIPSNNGIREMLAKDASGVDKQSLDFQDQIKDKVGDAPEITPNGAGELDDIIGRYGQKVMFGEQSSSDAAAAMIKEVQSAIASA